MNIIRVYRNINAKDKFLGLELADGGVLLAAFFLAFNVNSKGIAANAAFLIMVYAGLRALKRGKPDGYTISLARYAFSPRLRRRLGHDEADPVGGYASR